MLFHRVYATVFVSSMSSMPNNVVDHAANCMLESPCNIEAASAYLGKLKTSNEENKKVFNEILLTQKPPPIFCP